MSEENMSANITYVLNKLKTFEAANDTTVAHLMRRLSLQENKFAQNEMIFKEDFKKLQNRVKTLEDQIAVLALEKANR